MEQFAVALFAVAVIGIPVALLLKNDYGKKRGCGRGCSSCGNREICWRGQEKNGGKKKEEQADD